MDRNHATEMADYSLQVSFEDWTSGRIVPTLGTNDGAPELPFQGWRHFKEAFAPELVARAVRDSPIPVRTCLDAFGGSGTTALACQFLGVKPTLIEVNPFLADLAEAKVSIYDITSICEDLGRVVREATAADVALDQMFKGAPPTLFEPGLNGRYVFHRSVAERLAGYRYSIESLENVETARLFRVLLGSVAMSVSNVVVSGKGRRYRQGWQNRRSDPDCIDRLFTKAVSEAIGDICRFTDRAETTYRIIRGDARELIDNVESIDLAVFSPPYPNSFDYTDVYNVELWTLGYLDGPEANRELRNSTLSSHVQLLRDFPPAPRASPRLECTMNDLAKSRRHLWNRHIPEMVGGYFADMLRVLGGIKPKLTAGGHIAMVIGDSRYAGVHIATAEILSELVASLGYEVVAAEPFRSMRSSVQQGGRLDLMETLLVLEAE